MVLALIVLGNVALAQRTEFPEYHCYIDIPPEFAMFEFVDMTNWIEEHKLTDEKSGFEKQVRSTDSATIAVSIMFGNATSANAPLHADEFVKGMLSPVDGNVFNFKKHVINGIPVVDFATYIAAEELFITSRSLATNQRLYGINIFTNDTSDVTKSKIATLLNGFGFDSTIRGSNPVDQRPWVWFEKAVTGAIIALLLGWWYKRSQARKNRLR